MSKLTPFDVGLLAVLTVLWCVWSDDPKTHVPAEVAVRMGIGFAVALAVLFVIRNLTWRKK